MMPYRSLALALLLLTTSTPAAAQTTEASQLEEREARLQKLEQQLRSKEERTRWRGIRASARMGKAAVPMLSKLLASKQSHPADAAAEALCLLGPEAVDSLKTARQMLNENSVQERRRALKVIGQVGPYDQDDIESLKRAVYDQLHVSRVRVRGKPQKRFKRVRTDELVSAMVPLHEAPDASVDDLIVHLGGTSAAHTEMALDFLARRKPSDARRAIPQIRALLDNNSLRRSRFQFRGNGFGWSGSTSSGTSKDTIHIKAALLLMQLGDRKLPVAAQVKLLKHSDPAMRQRAILALGGSRKKISRAGVSALQRATSDKDKLVAWDAITALGMLGPAAKSAVPTLRRIAASPDKARAARAQAALRSINRESKDPRPGKD